jgi:hypothetical protein
MTRPADTPFDVDTATKTISGALIQLITMGFRKPEDGAPTEADGANLMKAIQDSLLAGSLACAEIKRIQADIAAMRDTHRPRPHADPTKPGALCEACSLSGALVAWPCGPWSAAEKVLTRGQR